MFTQKRTLIVIGAVVVALGLVAPALAKPELPEGYKLPAAQPGVWAPMAVQAEALVAEKSTGYSPQALRALGLRGKAMAAYFEESTGYTPQALQALGLRGEAMATYFEKSTGYTPQALQALGERGEAMSTYYLDSGTPDWVERAALREINGGRVQVGRQAPDVIQSPTRDLIGVDAVGRTAPTLASPVADDSFDWNTVGLAGGTALFLVALAIGGLVGVRSRGGVAHP